MVTRREFLAGMSAAAAAAAAGGPAALVRAGEAPAAPGGRSRVVVLRRDELRDAAKLDAPAAKALLDIAARRLAGAEKPADAWARWFKADDRLGIKVNCLGLPTTPAVALGLADAVTAAGLRPEQIVVWDRFNRELRAAGYDLRSAGAGVRCFGTDAVGTRGGYDDQLSTSGRIGSLYSRIVTEIATALVSAAVLKDHNLAGLSAGLKNFYGAIHNPNKYHEDGCDPFVADVAAHPHIRARLRLVVVDATRPQYHGGPPERGQWRWPYGALIVGSDPVAVDRVGAEILDRKRVAAGLATLADDGRPVRYLASAQARGLGTADLARIEIVSDGKPWNELD